jgi:hypothetical protein
VFAQIQANASPASDNAMAQVRTMLEDRVRTCEIGQENLVKLREQIQIQEQLSNPGNGQQNASTEMGQGGQYLTTTGEGNPWMEGTPTPGSGYGPGPGTGDCLDCTPAAGQQQYQFNTPGAGYGGTQNGSGYGLYTSTPMGENGKKY